MSRNPILSDKAFEPSRFSDAQTIQRTPSPAEEWAGAQAMQAADVNMGVPAQAPAGPIVTTGRAMSLGGVASATFLFLMVVVAAGWFGWTQVTGAQVDQVTGQILVEPTFEQPVLFFVAMFVALGFAILTAFKPKLARVTGFAYALAEGYVLGVVSHFFDAQWNGIVVQAILATSGVFLTMLALYGLRILRVTPRMTKGIIAATFGVMFLYLFGFIASLFGAKMSFIYGTGGGTFGILISLVIVGIASFNLLLDFDFIERGTKQGLPAYMDWYAAFGLLVTLVWIYIEMLRLLARLRSN